MRLAAIKVNNIETGGIVLDNGILPLGKLNQATGTTWEESVSALIRTGQIRELNAWYRSGGKEACLRIPGIVPFSDGIYAPLYRDPGHIFSIGLNYADHAGDIGETAPEDFPGSFFKSPDIMIGYGDEIHLPRLKEALRTTAEAELGIIIGKECRDVDEENWLDVVAGFTTILDMTEESILKGNEFVKGNPRYLTIAKNFPTFFSFGPQLVTPDEIADVYKLEVQSVLNGEVYARNVVVNMTHKPPRIVSLHSRIQGWYPGDVLSTGTPRAFTVKDGDVAECRILGPDGFSMEPLINPVKDLKKAERNNDPGVKNE